MLRQAFAAGKRGTMASSPGSQQADRTCSSIPRHRRVASCLSVVAIFLSSVLAACGPSQEDVLPSWNEGPSKKAIVEFVSRVTTPAGSDYVAPPERIAVFDNDGTLWSEQPIYVQLAFMLDRVKALAPQHPEWQGQEPFASVLKGDIKGALAGGERGLLEMMAATHAGMTTEEFDGVVREWIATARHPKTGRPYTEMVYQPMLELLSYLRANGFKTFIVSGGGVDFMRVWTEKAYGIPPEQVVGSVGKTKVDMRDGRPVLSRLPDVDLDRRQGGQDRRHSPVHRPPADFHLWQFGRRQADA